MNILIVYVNNKNAVKGKDFDIRYKIFTKIAFHLKKKNKIYVMPCDSGSKLTKDITNNFELFNYNKSKNIDLCIAWNPIIIKNKLKNKFNCEFICFENGILKDSIIIDPKGLTDNSYYINSLNEICKNNYNNAETMKYIEMNLKNDNSKRPQTLVYDIPQDILNKFIFIPTQKHTDISLINAKISMFNCIKQTTLECKKNKLSLVIKIHPGINGRLLHEQLDLIKHLKNKVYKNIFLSKSSINYLMKYALGTITVNGSSVMDNFMNSTPVYVLSPCLYYNTDAVVKDDTFEKGFNKLIQKDYDKEKMFNKQKEIISWYLNHNLFYEYSIEKNIDILNKHLKNKIIY